MILSYFWWFIKSVVLYSLFGLVFGLDKCCDLTVVLLCRLWNVIGFLMSQMWYANHSGCSRTQKALPPNANWRELLRNFWILCLMKCGLRGNYFRGSFNESFQIFRPWENRQRASGSQSSGCVEVIRLEIRGPRDQMPDLGLSSKPDQTNCLFAVGLYPRKNRYCAKLGNIF